MPNMTKNDHKRPRSCGHPRPTSTELAMNLTLGSILCSHTQCQEELISPSRPRRGNFWALLGLKQGNVRHLAHTLHFAFFGFLQPGPGWDQLFSELA